MIVLENGDLLEGDATTASEVDFTIHGLDNNALKQLADGQLANSKGTIFTANSTDVVSSIILVNTGVAANAVNLYLTPSGGTARRLIAKDLALGAGHSLHFEGGKVMVLNTSGQIIYVGATGDKGDPGVDGDDGAAIESVAWNGNDMRFTLDDASTVDLANAKIDLKGAKGDEGDPGDMTNPMTTALDVIVGGVAGAPARLAKGTAKQVLSMNEDASAIAWADASGGTEKWVEITDFTATPPTTAIATANFTFAASTSVSAATDCKARGVKVGHLIWNSTNDTVASAKQIIAISDNGLTITLASAYGGTTGASKEASVRGDKLTMTADKTAIIKVGMGLRYTIGATVYYGRVSAITSNLLTVDGIALTGDVTALAVGGEVRPLIIIIPGLYEDASSTGLIVSDLLSQFIWLLPTSYLVHARFYSRVHDQGATHGQASVRINATETNLLTGGPYLAANTTWYSTGIDIAPAAYDINPGEVLDVTSVKGTTGDGADLTAEMVFVTP